jgi:putative GTP pyrophosphokinase
MTIEELMADPFDASSAATRRELELAGDVLRDPKSELAALVNAELVLNTWRGLHGYPLYIFQSTLRKRLKKIAATSFVAQRLKRTPSIKAKLEKIPSLKLHKMQDIGGLRAVVPQLAHLRQLEKLYENPRFVHPLLKKNDYVSNPKKSGYRSIHLVYVYRNEKFPAFNGLKVEIQLRTRLQHAWATAVETAGTFLRQALKSSSGSKEWLDFFALAGSAFSRFEGGPPVPGFEDRSEEETYIQTIQGVKRLDVVRKLRTFTLAVQAMTREKRRGEAYYVLSLNAAKRSLEWMVFGKNELAEASEFYRSMESVNRDNESVQVVLVSSMSLSALKRAYPNYFLDTDSFLEHLGLIYDRMKRMSSNPMGFLPDVRTQFFRPLSPHRVKI